MPAKANKSILIIYGLAVVPGLACGRPFLLSEETSIGLIKTNTITKDSNTAGHEIDKYTSARTMLSERLKQLEARAKSKGRIDEADILSFHNTILEDEALMAEIFFLITEEELTAAEAVSQTYMKQIRRFELIEDERIRSKALDLYDILNNILLLIHADDEALITSIPENSIVIADTLSPSQLIALPSENIAGIVCEYGEAVSHTAVLAAGLQIPVVFKCHGILDYFRSTSIPEAIMIDGKKGQVIVNPERCKTELSFASINISKKSAITADGIRLELLANIVNIEEYGKSTEIYYDGTGLLRTETLFAGSMIKPDEELQYMRYRQAVALASHNPGPIIFRTFDLAVPLGNDKSRLAIVSERLCNPNERGLARSLRQESELRTQLRAIIRACAGRKCSILFPMVMSASDFSRAEEIAQDVQSQLAIEDVKLPSELQLGAMIETPEAVNDADQLFELADFISIGSNDLASYTTGGLFTSENTEMIRRLTSRTEVINGQKKVILCGELAASPEILPLWLNLGLRSFSINFMRMEDFKKSAAVINSDGSIPVI